MHRQNRITETNKMHATCNHKRFSNSRRNRKYNGTTNFPQKLEEEGAWETRKEILGWLLDGIQKTIQLPPDKCDKLLSLLTEISRKSVATVKELQSMQGKLQFASIGIPLGKPLLGPIDRIIAEAERNKRTKVKIKQVIITYTRN